MTSPDMELSACPGAGALLALALLAAVLAHCGAAALDLEDSDMAPAAAGESNDAFVNLEEIFMMLDEIGGIETIEFLVVGRTAAELHSDIDVCVNVRSTWKSDTVHGQPRQIGNLSKARHRQRCYDYS